MYEFVNIPVGKQAQSMDISPQFQPYSGVEVVVSEDSSYFVGNETGRVLRVENEWGSQQQAQNILDSLTSTGFQYQPYTASGAILNPAAEIGDGVTLNGVYSGLYKISRNYSSLMAADIEAPQDEEVDHEFPFEPKQDRIYKREIADAKAQIKINHDSIEAEVLRASEAEGELRSSLTQTATEIRASVLSRTGGASNSFGWTLTDRSWEINSNGSTVLKASADGLEVSGKITATSGFIGNGANGFTISATSISNGMESLNDTANNGIFIGTNGIALGKGNFKVTSGGSVSANNMTLTGTLTIGGTSITAAALGSGAQSAFNNSGTWNGTSSTVNSNGVYWSGGGFAGVKFDNMANNTGAYPINASSFRVNGTQYSPRDITISDSFGTRTFHGVLMYSVG